MKTVGKQAKHILLADDNVDVREMTRVLLEKYGHLVTATDCGSEALRVFSINPGYFDVVILDQEMPDLKGTDIAPQLVGLRSNVPIVLYTGCVDDDLVEKARKAGIKEVALKPLPVDLLLEVIDRNSNGAPVGSGARMRPLLPVLPDLCEFESYRAADREARKLMRDRTFQRRGGCHEGQAKSIRRKI